jgi:putative Holliday junction resolvase
MKGRILGIDYGKARIGLALSDPLGVTAQPLEVIRVYEMQKALSRIASIVKERDVRGIVLGLPLNMDGSVGPQAAETRSFAALLEVETGLKPVEWDERLTSRQALSALGQQERSWRKRQEKLDAVAAQILLQSYLDSNPSS